jgi:hypothetical protein
MNSRRKITIALTTFTILFMITIVATYAYFQIEEDHGITITTGDFEVEMFVYFDGDLVTFNSPYYDREKGVVIVNAYDENSNNYIEDLDIYISINPVVAARYRFKIQQEWELQRYYLNQSAGNEIDPVLQAVYFENLGSNYYPFSQLKFESSYTPLFDQEGYIYDANIVEKNTSDVLYHIIDGGDAYDTRTNDAIDEMCYLYFDIDFEIVQANRFSEVWGIDSSFYD